MMEKFDPNANKPYRQSLHSKSDQRAQATLMMVERLMGKGSHAQLAAKFGVKPRTISNRLALARSDGVPESAREIFIDEMLPSSMAVLKEALAGEDLKLAVQVAMKIVDGLNVMDQQVQASASTEETLEVFRARLTRKKVDEIECDGPVIDAESDRVCDPRALSESTDMEARIEAPGAGGTETVCIPGIPWDGSDAAPTSEAYQAYLGDSGDASSVSVESASDAAVDHENE